MREFEELEGLAEQFVEDTTAVADEKDDDDASMKPLQASALPSTDVYIEVILFDNYVYE